MPKFYVVWKGRETGIFDNWEDCKTQIHGFKDAEYKSFKTKELAEQAFNGNSKEFIGKNFFETELSQEELLLLGEPELDSISVDGAWNTSTGKAEYRGVETRTGKQIFHQGPFNDGTNNIVEFLAIVHGLAFLKKQNKNIPIYTDSKTAISWVRSKKCGTEHKENEDNQELFNLIRRAEKWLEENDYEIKVLKWETKAWGEIKADFGRK